MPKCQFVDPNEARKPGKLSFKDIDLNQYNKTIAEEKKNFSTEDFMRIYHDMAVIREFETMLYSIKTKSEYNGIEYSNPGPAHLSMGQEASAVGQAYLLGVDDYIFGSQKPRRNPCKRYVRHQQTFRQRSLRLHEELHGRQNFEDR